MRSPSVKVWCTVLCLTGAALLFLSWSLRAIAWPRVGFEAALFLSGVALVGGPVLIFAGVLIGLLSYLSSSRSGVSSAK
jgi:hypothetical protein